MAFIDGTKVVASDLANEQEDQYFSSNPAPETLKEHVSLVRDFIDFHSARQNRVVLVTSGGTTVPLEKRTVRFSKLPPSDDAV
jgi:phosphopantothenate-cysteine ligase